jgi:chaperonin GroES
MSLRPIYDRVVVRPLEAETTTSGGIIIPGKSAEKPTRGVVLSTGDGAVTENGELRPVSVKAGETVLYGQYAGNKVKIDGEDLLIIKESDILAVIEDSSIQEKLA